MAFNAQNQDIIQRIRLEPDTGNTIPQLAQVEKAVGNVSASLGKLDASAVTSTGTLERAVASLSLDYKVLADNAQTAQTRSELYADSLADIELIAAQLTQPLDAANTAGQKVVATIHDIGVQIDHLPEPDLSAFEGAAGTTTGRGVNPGSSSARQVIGQAGGLLATAGASQAGSAVASVIALTDSLGPLGVGAALIVGLFKGVSDAEQQAGESAKKYIADLEGVNKLVAGGVTTAEVQKNIADLETLRKVQIDGRDALRLIQEQYENTTTAWDKGIISFDTYSDTIHLLNDQADQLTGGTVKFAADIGKSVTEAQTGINNTTTAIGVYNAQLGSQQLSLNDSADGIKRLAQANKDLEDQRAAAQVDGAQKVLAADQLTAAQRQAKIDLDGREILLLHQQLQDRGLSQSAAEKLRAQLSGLKDEMDYLGKISNSYADQLAREAAAKKAATDVNQSYLDVVKQEGDLRSKIAETEAGLATIQTEAQGKLTALAEDRTSKITDLETDASEKRVELAQETAAAIAKVERDTGRARGNAIGNRDADSFRLANQRAADALEDQNKQQQKQVESVAKNLTKQEAAINKSYQQQVASVTQSENQQLALKRQSLLAQQTDLLNITNAETAIARNSSIGIVSIVENMWQRIEAIFRVRSSNTLNNLGNIAGQLYQGATSAFNSPTPLPAATNGYGTQGAITAQQARNIALDTTRTYLSNVILRD